MPSLLDYSAAAYADATPAPGGWVDAAGSNWSLAGGKLKRPGATVWYAAPLYRAESVKDGRSVAVVTGTTGMGLEVCGRLQTSGLARYSAYYDGANLYLFVTNAGGNSGIGATPGYGQTVGRQYALELVCASVDPTHTTVTANLYDLTAGGYVDPVSGRVLVSAGGANATPVATVTVAGDTTGPQVAGRWGIGRVGVVDPGVSRYLLRTDDYAGVPAASLTTSPLNWDLRAASTGGYVQSQNAGATLKAKVRNTATVKLVVDPSPELVAGIASAASPVIWIRVGDAPVYSTSGTLGSAGQIDPSGSVVIDLANGLSGDTQVEVGIVATGSADRWSAPANVLRVRGLLLDPGGSALPPTVRPGVLLAYGDSISEGVRTRGTSASGDTLYNRFAADVLPSWAPALAAQLDCELGLVAYGSQGYAAAGAGGVPALPVAWAYQSSGVSRLVGGLLSPAPTYLVDAHGTNDAGASAATVRSLVAAQLAAYRAAAPDAVIVKLVPWGGFQRSAITAGYNDYQAATGDPRCVLVDLGTEIQAGLTNAGVGSYRSSDGIHPWAFVHAETAAKVAGRVAEASADDGEGLYAEEFAELMAEELERAGGPLAEVYGVRATDRLTVTGGKAAVTDASVAAIAGAVESGQLGTGDTPVDHNTGGTDALRVTDSGGNGLDGVAVTAYVADDLTANGAGAEREGRTITKADGRWASPLMLDAGVTYTILFTLSGKGMGEATVTP